MTAPIGWNEMRARAMQLDLRVGIFFNKSFS